MKWTTEKLNTFFAMKDQGYSLAEIAAELGCTYYAAQTQNKNMKRTKKKAEAAKVTEATEVTETAEPVEAPIEIPAVEKTINAENNAESLLNHANAPTDTSTETAADHIGEDGKKVSRADILDRAKAIVTGEREKQYGKPEDNFAIVAGLWSAYTGYKFSPVDVAMMMVLLKVARIKTGDYLADNYVDICGYVACAGEIAGKGATTRVQPAGDAENENMSKCSGEKNDAQRAK